MGNPRIAYLNRWRLGDLFSIFEPVHSHPEYPIEFTQGDIPSDFWRTAYGTGSGLSRFQVTANTANLDFFIVSENYTVTAATNSNYDGTTLASEIQAKMRAANIQANNFAVAFSESTGKFTISNPDSDFTLFWANGASRPAGTNTCIGTTIGFNVATDDNNDHTYTSDERRNYYPSATVRQDMLTDVTINFAALIKHNVGNTATVIVHYSNQNNFANVAAVTIANANAPANAGNHFTFMANNYTDRYWRIYITDYTNALGYTQCGPVFLGRWYELNRPPLITYERGKVDPSELTYSDSMSAYALERPRLDTWTYSWRGLSDNSANTVLNLLEQCGTHKPFVFCRDSADVNNTTDFVRLVDISQPQRERANYWSWRATLQEVV